MINDNNECNKVKRLVDEINTDEMNIKRHENGIDEHKKQLLNIGKFNFIERSRINGLIEFRRDLIETNREAIKRNKKQLKELKKICV